MRPEQLLNSVEERAKILNRKINKSIKARKIQTKEYNWADETQFLDESNDYLEAANRIKEEAAADVLRFFGSGDKNYLYKLSPFFSNLANVNEKYIQFVREWVQSDRIPPDLAAAQMNGLLKFISESSVIVVKLVTENTKKHGMVKDPDIRKFLKAALEFSTYIDSGNDVVKEAAESPTFKNPDLVKEFVESVEVFTAGAQRIGSQISEAMYWYYAARNPTAIQSEELHAGMMASYDELERMWDAMLRFDREFEDKIPEKKRKMFRTAMHGFFRYINKMTLDTIQKIKKKTGRRDV
jgi:hypothetical protein